MIKMHGQLYKIIFDSGLVPNADIKIHIEAIERGDYSLIDLLENAQNFYSFDQYAHETVLMDSM